MIEPWEKKGIYFKSERDISTEYFIEVLDGAWDGNWVVNVYRFDKNISGEYDYNIKSGDDIVVEEYNMNLVANIDMVSKYYTLTIEPHLQLYYCGKKHYGGEWESNSIISLMECIDYAIDYAIKIKNVKPY